MTAIILISLNSRSHLTRGAWIEIINDSATLKRIYRRTSHEVRGLKYLIILRIQPEKRRTSHEVRGLKFPVGIIMMYGQLSHLTRGAWIEIIVKLRISVLSAGRTSHEVRGLKS